MAPQLVITATYDATGDDEVGIMALSVFSEPYYLNNIP